MLTEHTDRHILVGITGERVELAPYRIVWLAKLIHSTAFEVVIALVIVLNAVAIALLTLPSLPAEVVKASNIAIQVIFIIYVVELALRILSYGSKPWMFFRRGWNIFDFFVIVSTPLLMRHSELLRLLRLLRLVRILRFLPEVRLLSTSIRKSIPPLFSMTVLIVLMMFLFGMSGTYLFGDEAPGHWGNILISLETLLDLLTLDSFGGYFSEGLEITPWAIPFFLTYMFLIVFIVLNVLVGIVLFAMDQARTEIANEQPAVAQVSSLSARIQSAVADGQLTTEEIEVLRAEVDVLKASIDAIGMVPKTSD